MTASIRDHIALINNDDTIFDLSIDETTALIDNAIAYYAKQLAYLADNVSDSHLDDYIMISDILPKLMLLSSYNEVDMTSADYSYSTLFDTTFDASLINDILYFDHYNNCALIADRPTILNHFNKLTEEQLDSLMND